MGTKTVEGISRHKKGATYYHAQLRPSDIGCAITWLDVSNILGVSGLGLTIMSSPMMISTNPNQSPKFFNNVFSTTSEILVNFDWLIH